MKTKLLLCLLAIVLAGLTHAALGQITVGTSVTIKATVGWNPNPETNIAKYKVYSGKASGQYDTVKEFPIGDLVGVTFDGDATGGPWVGGTIDLPLGSKIFSVVTAVNTPGLESLPSNEITIQTPDRPAAPGFPIVITINADGTLSVSRPDQPPPQ